MTPTTWKKRLKVNPLTAFLARSAGRLACRSVKTFVFVASTGRSGTNTLQEVLEGVPRCVALHEPHPILNREALIRFNQGDPSLMRRDFWLRKLPNVYRAAAFQTAYVETNHMFVKSYAEEASKAFPRRLQVVHLRRDPLAVAVSFHHRGSIPGTAQGKDWTLDYRAPRNLLQLTAELEGEFAHPMFRCLWYPYEIDARTRAFSRAHPHVPVHALATKELNDAKAIERLIATLGLSPQGGDWRARVGRRANRSPKPPRLPEGVSQKAVARFQALCEERLAQV